MRSTIFCSACGARVGIQDAYAYGGETLCSECLKDKIIDECEISLDYVAQQMGAVSLDGGDWE